MIFDKDDTYVFCGYDKDVIDLISEIDAKFIGFLTNKKVNDFKSLGTHDQIDLSKKLFNKVLVSTEEIFLKKKIEDLSTWISYDDLTQLVDIGIKHKSMHNEIVYGASKNKKSWWNNSRAYRLGYKPKDSADRFNIKSLSNNE